MPTCASSGNGYISWTWKKAVHARTGRGRALGARSSEEEATVTCILAETQRRAGGGLGVRGRPDPRLLAWGELRASKERRNLWDGSGGLPGSVWSVLSGELGWRLGKLTVIDQVLAVWGQSSVGISRHSPMGYPACL